jgi:hypothetical protein
LDADFEHGLHFKELLMTYVGGFDKTGALRIDEQLAAPLVATAKAAGKGWRTQTVS